MLPGALVYTHSTLLGYAPNQIWLPHCTYMFQCTSSVVNIQTLHSCTHPLKINKLEHILTKLLLNMCQEPICPSNVTCQNNLICFYWGSMSTCIPCEKSLWWKLWSVGRATDHKCISWSTKSGKTTTPSQSGYCCKSVLSRPTHLPKEEIVQKSVLTR